MDNIVCPNIIIYDILNKFISENDNRFYNNIFVNNNFNKLEYSDKFKQNNEFETNNELETNNNFEQINDEIEQINDEFEQLNDEDPWETSINDDKFYINNKVARIFPVLKNFNNYSKIKIDDESFSYITIREIAELTTKIICYHLLEFNLNPQKINVVDYTSGVGGNVLSFCKYFNYIYAIELSQQRAEYLENNIGVYGFKNIKVVNKCAIEFNNNDLIQINPNVIYLDPPWGGTNYKNNENLLLKLGDISIEELIVDISIKFSIYYENIVNLNLKEKKNNLNNKLIILKLPKNYDVEYLYNYIKNNNNLTNYNLSLYLYVLNKMIIIVCELQFKFY